MLLPTVVLAHAPGTLGFSVVQLYGDQEPNKRGVLMVRMVDQGSAAEEAGIGVGDVIVSVNGMATEGHDGGELGRAGLWGAGGENVRLMVVKGHGAPAERVLTRKPYAPHVSRTTDAFHYSIAGTGRWIRDIRFRFHGRLRLHTRVSRTWLLLPGSTMQTHRSITAI
jgi:hypothetical protein